MTLVMYYPTRNQTSTTHELKGFVPRTVNKVDVPGDWLSAHYPCGGVQFTLDEQSGDVSTKY